MTTALILQARMGSTRLPGKSMMDLAGAPLVGRILERVRRCTRVDRIVLATTMLAEDDPLCGLGREYGVAVFRGAQNDLVDRYCQAAAAHDADVIVRLPADNPTPEPAEIDRIIDFYRQGGGDFASNLSEVYGNGYPDGIGAEVFSRAALEWARDNCADPQRREHPHLNFFDYAAQAPAHPDRFTVGTVQCPAAFRRPDLILDVNTPAQYRFMKALYEALYPRNPRFGIMDIIRWHDEEYRPLMDAAP